MSDTARNPETGALINPPTTIDEADDALDAALAAEETAVHEVDAARAAEDAETPASATAPDTGTADALRQVFAAVNGIHDRLLDMATQASVDALAAEVATINSPASAALPVDSTPVTDLPVGSTPVTDLPVDSTPVTDLPVDATPVTDPTVVSPPA